MIIVNFATKEYKAGQQRLQASLNGHKCLLFRNYHEIGSPTHSDSPYEFKVHAIKKALEVDDIVLWCDSSLWLVGDLGKVERIIKTEGFFGEESGHYAGRWCNAFQRQYMKLTDQEAKQEQGGITLFSAGLLGLNRNHEIAMRFLAQLEQAGKDGAFRGSWEDSRHEMTIASIIATRLGFKYQRGGSHLAYVGPGYSAPEPGIVFKLQGI